MGQGRGVCLQPSSPLLMSLLAQSTMLTAWFTKVMVWASGAGQSGCRALGEARRGRVALGVREWVLQ